VPANKTEENVPLSRKLKRELQGWFWVVVAFLFIQGTLVQARVIPSESMLKTLLIGDHVLVSRFGYDAGVPFTTWHFSLWRQPARQQVIVFHPPLPDQPDYVKRVIGVPGDRVEIRAGSVWVNGKPLVEPYLSETPDPSENLGPYLVPPGNFFMMGDNRNNSSDSRRWGFVPRSSIVGSPVVIYLSVDSPGEAWQPGHLRERLAAYGLALIHPGRVRWERLFVPF
jgi:signal peptidase I